MATPARKDTVKSEIEEKGSVEHVEGQIVLPDVYIDDKVHDAGETSMPEPDLTANAPTL